jgi:polyferredoxin
LILAWPLNVYNVFTNQPLGWWLAISFIQTFVLIPLGIYYFGKGVYCGWICSCGALAETLGDTHRHKMPHGPFWNRLNMAGQVVLAVAVALLIVRILGWVLPAGNWADRIFEPVLKTRYKWIVDVFLAGVVGYGVYFWYSGRVWCRFFCPLAALMHVYARFSRFAIIADKKKCISCNVCTSVCHQGIDVMSFANKGAPMTDPECVRCSACVQSCPTGVLEFGQTDRSGRTIRLDLLPASPVRMREEGASLTTAAAAHRAGLP